MKRLLALAFVLLAGACGGGDDTTETTADPELVPGGVRAPIERTRDVVDDVEQRQGQLDDAVDY